MAPSANQPAKIVVVRVAWLSALLVEGCQFAVCFAAMAQCAHAAADLSIHTSDTALVVEAGASAPRLAQLQGSSGASWKNRAAEEPIPFVEVEGRKVPATWRLNTEAAETDSRRIVLVYENAFPRLRLKWEWEARAEFGPIEHRVRIENLSDQELWLPLLDSFCFDFAVALRVKLEHMYVEKGDGAPSEAGTHLVSIPAGYKWTGTSAPMLIPSRPSPERSFRGFWSRRLGRQEMGGMWVSSSAG